ncbi:MAG: hypothetical protein ACRC6C_01745 [Wolbachia pipientis]
MVICLGKGDTVFEISFLATSLQKKWKSLRDSYARELSKKKKDKSGSGATGRKQYVFFEQLCFLETVAKSTKSSFEGEEHEDSVDDTIDDNKEAEETTAPTCSRKRSRLSQNKESVEEANLLSLLKAKFLTRETEDEEKDEDKLFMLSLVPELKKIPEHLKLDTKGEIINVIKRARQQIAPPAFGNYALSQPGPSFNSRVQYQDGYRHAHSQDWQHSARSQSHRTLIDMNTGSTVYSQNTVSPPGTMASSPSDSRSTSATSEI